LPEATTELRRLYQSDPTFRDHVDPEGFSYIERIVLGGKVPIMTTDTFQPEHDQVLDLLGLFTKEFGMVRGVENPRRVWHEML
jgi:5-keto 4-deoxyuronate isomerase